MLILLIIPFVPYAAWIYKFKINLNWWYLLCNVSLFNKTNEGLGMKTILKNSPCVIISRESVFVRKLCFLVHTKREKRLSEVRQLGKGDWNQATCMIWWTQQWVDKQIQICFFGVCVTAAVGEMGQKDLWLTLKVSCLTLIYKIKSGKLNKYITTVVCC